MEKCLDDSIVILTFGRDDRLEAGGEEAVELKIVDLGGEIAHPDGEIAFAGQQPV